MLDIKITKTTQPKAKPAADQPLGFGHIFTDHMFVMNYTEGKGWHDARIVPYGTLAIEPSAMVCTLRRHYPFAGGYGFPLRSGDV